MVMGNGKGAVPPISKAEVEDSVTVVRILEYHGPRKWVESTLMRSKIPMQGAIEFGPGMTIRSGLVEWMPTIPEEPPKKISHLPPPSGGA